MTHAGSDHPPTFVAPTPLLVAAALTALEGAAVVVLAVLELLSVTGGRLAMGLTTALFFAVYGLGLMACGWAITRGRLWARGPLLLAQLIQLGLAWSFRGGATTLVSVAIGLVAVVVIFAMLHPRTIIALNDAA